MRQLPAARKVAADVLVKVDTDRSYANIELNKRLRSSNLETRDRALATELVYGTLRWRGSLDRVVAKASSRPLAKLTPVVRNVLRLTAYQILCLTQIPARAAIYEGVELVRQLGYPEAASFTNAVARRIQREGALPVPRNTDNAAELADIWSHPCWLVERWLQRYGLTTTLAVLRANQEPAPLVLRVNTLRVSRVDFLAKLRKTGVRAGAGRTPDAVVVLDGVAVDALPGYEEGWYVVQDESSQLVSLALDPQPGEAVADLCSAPGGKTTHLAQRMGDCGRIMAVELHPHRAQLVRDTASRLGMRSIQVICEDSRGVAEHQRSSFDRVLLDVPCTGTGVLRRRVDLRWRLTPEDISSLAELQSELLRSAAELVRPGGCLVYSTCSIERDENSDQVAAFLSRNGQFTRGSLTHLSAEAPALANVTEHPEVENGELQLLPSETADGFFLAALERLP
jgi:16S rRNA (cytosine967-C5)-methyltransferase